MHGKRGESSRESVGDTQSEYSDTYRENVTKMWQEVKNDVKNSYFLEKYRKYSKGKGRLFDKQYLLLSNIYVKKQ